MHLRSTHVSRPPFFALSLLALGAIANISHADVVQVYLQAGQSNADGRGNPSGLPTTPFNFRLPQDDVAFFFHTEGSRHSLDSTLTTLRPGQSETSQFGPEITFGRDLADSLADTPDTSIAIIKYANGGTDLNTQWRAGGDSSTAGDGVDYAIFQNTVTEGLAAITAANPGDTITIAGMIWHQGESDNVSSSTALAYEANLTNFLADVRATYGANLPIVIGEILVNGGNTNTATIRAAQATVAAANPLNGFLDVDTFPMQDILHFSPAGLMSLGSGFASELLALQGVAGPSTPEPIAITPTADTYIRDSVSTTNFGSDDFMVANDNDDNVRIAIFNFDLTSVPPGTIQTARLQLQDVIGNATQSYEIWGLLDVDESFDESTLTWDTANFVSSNGLSVDPTKAFGAAPLGTFDNTANSINTVFDVTSGTFLDFLNASEDSDVTFVIVDTDTGRNGTGWATKEHASALIPTLTLNDGVDSTYASWAATFPELDLSDPNADLDLDGISNALESWFGTDPGEASAGVSIASSDTTVSTFTHPQDPTPPSDLTSSYEWSLNLLDWHESGSGPVGGPTAIIVPNTVESTTTVTLTASEATEKLFFRATVELSAP